MLRFNKILYVFNIAQSNRVGLLRACNTAILNKADLAILVTDGIVEYESETRNLIASLLPKNIKLEDITVSFSYQSSRVDIIKKVISEQYYLLITEPDPVSGIKKFFYGTTTLALLSKCPCIVWVVKSKLVTPYNKIMAAVDPASDNPNSAALTDTIIELAVSMAERNHAECHIVHAWSLELESASENPFFGSTTKECIEQDVLAEKNRHIMAFEEMMERQTVDLTHCVTHIIKGDARKELAEFSVSHDIDLIVMGTLEKVGVEGVLMGSTAESLVNQIECSILAVKPATFVSPIKYVK